LFEALRHISVDLQLVLELHYWEGMSTRELSVVLELPHGTVKSRLRRAREALREVLEAPAAAAPQPPATADELDEQVQALRAVAGRARTRGARPRRGDPGHSPPRSCPRPPPATSPPKCRPRAVRPTRGRTFPPWLSCPHGVPRARPADHSTLVFTVE